MTTLSALKARIADDLRRTDLTSNIADAISDAINHYKEERFYFNETRTDTFATVANQSRYTSSDDADIPLFVELDAVYLEDTNSENYLLSWMDPVEMESLLDNSASTGRPYAYAYFGQSFWFYPIPDAAYTIRPIGHIEKAAPATDAETGNVWMTEAFELIRCRGKAYLAAHILRDPGILTAMQGARPGMDPPGGAEGVALAKLRRNTNKRVGSGRITPTNF